MVRDIYPASQIWLSSIPDPGFQIRIRTTGTFQKNYTLFRILCQPFILVLAFPPMPSYSLGKVTIGRAENRKKLERPTEEL
jgi:hypothetical protein